MNEETKNPILPEEPMTSEEPPKKASFVSALFDYLEIVVWSIFAVMMLFTFVTRICQVDGESMENTFRDSEKLFVYSLGYTPKQDDVVVFHLTDPSARLDTPVLIKRVIATGGQELEINFRTREIFVDGVLYEDSHAVFKARNSDEDIGRYQIFPQHNYDAVSGIFHATVPEGRLFVMGDNRNHSRDSRSLDIGFVDERCILGKVVLRLSPFTVFD